MQYNFKMFSAGRVPGGIKLSPVITGVPRAICCLALWYQHHWVGVEVGAVVGVEVGVGVGVGVWSRDLGFGFE